MIRLLCFALAVLASPFKSMLRLEAENGVLRHQLIVLTRPYYGFHSAFFVRAAMIAPRTFRGGPDADRGVEVDAKGLVVGRLEGDRQTGKSRGAAQGGNRLRHQGPGRLPGGGRSGRRR